jgi:oxygen-dependent protoporphyrinogen oxidase
VSWTGIRSYRKTTAYDLPEGNEVRLNVEVRDIERTSSGFRLAGIHSRALVLAAGLRATARMSGLGIKTDLLARVQHPPLVVSAFGFRREDVTHPLDGFGMLIPAHERRTVLGALFTSTLFDERAPAGHVLVTTYAGGARNPQVLDVPPDRLRRDILGDLADFLGCRAEPVFEHMVRWPAAIPQYDVHYDDVLAELDRLESTHEGLHFAGNYRNGVSVSDTIRQACSTADRILT